MRGRAFRLQALFVILVILVFAVSIGMTGPAGIPARCQAAVTAAAMADATPVNTAVVTAANMASATPVNTVVTAADMASAAAANTAVATAANTPPSPPADTAEDDYLELSGTGNENDTYSNATAIELGSYENLRCLDADWYKFTLTEEMALRVTLLFSNSANGNLDCVLYKQDESNPSWSPDDSEWIASSFSQTDNEEILFQGHQAGTYYCEVFSSTPKSDNRYAMEIEGFVYTPTVCFYQWVDAPDTLLPLPSITSDDSFEEVSIGFPFFFFGERIDTLSISSNGYLTFGGDCATIAENDDLQSMAPPFNMIAPFWDDLNPEDGGEVYAWLDDQSSPRRFIVQWNSICSYDAGVNSSISFEVVLTEGTNAITFQYKDLLFNSASDDYSYGRSATAGLKYCRENQLISRLCSFNGQVNSPHLSDRLAICFAPSKIPVPPFIIGYVPSTDDPDSLFFPRDRSIAINFSEPMDTASTFSALSIWPAVQGHIKWLNNNQTLQFAPDTFWDGALAYTVSLDQTAKDSEGMCLPAIFEFTFTTDENMPAVPVERDTVPPQVTISLADNKTGATINPNTNHKADKVPVSSQIYLTFTESMDPRSIAGALSFSSCGQTQQPAAAAGAAPSSSAGPGAVNTCSTMNTCSDVAYTLTKNEDYTVWTLTPNQDLTYDSTYTVEIRPSATDLAGNALAASGSLEFRTCQKPVTAASATPATGQMFPNQGLTYPDLFSSPSSNSNLNTGGWSNFSTGTVTGTVGTASSMPYMSYSSVGGSFNASGLNSWSNTYQFNAASGVLPSLSAGVAGGTGSATWGQPSLTSGWMTSYSWLNSSTSAFASSYSPSGLIISSVPGTSFSQPSYDTSYDGYNAYYNAYYSDMQYNLTTGLSYSPDGTALSYSGSSNLILPYPFNNY
jgi:hypothetical protein